MTQRFRRLAIIGGGPRAVFALERIATLSGRHGVQAPVVDVFSADGGLGPGDVYATDQPEWLRLNVRAEAIDAWQASDGADRFADGLSFDDWRRDHDSGPLDDAFAPRALVGAYLAHVGAIVRSQVPGRTIRDYVRQVRHTGDGWQVGGSSYDAVLLAVGHEQAWAGSLAHRWPDDAVQLIEGVFPIARVQRGVADRPSGPVLIRGAALTAIDAMLALTHDRQHPSRIVLTSRTARLMAPKTEPAVVAALVDIDEATAPGRTLLRDPEWHPSGAEMPGLLVDAATRVHARVHGLTDRQARSAVDDAATAMLSAAPSGDPVGWLRRQLAVARGHKTPDPGWALAQAWRGLYADLIAFNDRARPRTPLGWPDYHRWSRELERLAFGPAPVNAETLLQGLESGRITVEPSTGNGMAARAEELGAVAVVDAVLAPSGFADPTNALLAGLQALGLISRAPGSRGIRIAPDATCLDVADSPVPGLAAVGRITEDSVIGNDTLIRTLHPHLDRWAHAVLGLDREVARVR